MQFDFCVEVCGTVKKTVRKWPGARVAESGDFGDNNFCCFEKVSTSKCSPKRWHLSPEIQSNNFSTLLHSHCPKIRTSNFFIRIQQTAGNFQKSNGNFLKLIIVPLTSPIKTHISIL